MSYAPSKKEYSTALVLATTSLVAFLGFTFLTFKEVKKAKAEVKQSGENSLGIDSTFLIKKQMNDLKDPIATLDAFFVQSGEEPYFVESLENLAKSKGLKIQTDSINLAKEDTADFKQILKVKVKFEGDWESCVSFLRGIEKLPEASNILSVKLGANPGSKVLWTGEAEIQTFKLKE